MIYLQNISLFVWKMGFLGTNIEKKEYRLGDIIVAQVIMWPDCRIRLLLCSKQFHFSKISESSSEHIYFFCFAMYIIVHIPTHLSLLMAPTTATNSLKHVRLQRNSGHQNQTSLNPERW